MPGITMFLRAASRLLVREDDVFWCNYRKINPRLLVSACFFQKRVPLKSKTADDTMDVIIVAVCERPREL